LNVKLIPLALKFGYEYQIKFGFGVQADLLAGYFFSRTLHYLTAIDMLMNNLQEDSKRNFFTGARAYATWSTKGKILKIYAGGGADVVIEDDGPIPLALVEVGLHIHPVMLIPRKKPKPEIVYEEPKIEETPKAEIYAEPEPTEEPEIEVYEEPEQEIELVQEPAPEPEPEPEPVRLLWLALFAADKTVPDAGGLAVMDQAALAIIGAEDGYAVTVKGYAAPLVSESGQNEVSRQRALFCKRYLIEKYGISEDRITVEWHGAKKTPEDVNNRDYSKRRSVEIIFEGIIPQQKNTAEINQQEREEAQEVQEAQNEQESQEKGEEE